MKKYINIKKFKLACAKNVQLATVAVVGLGITMFCSAYSVPEGCTPSVTVYAQSNGNYCGKALVGASCTGDDANDVVQINNNLDWNVLTLPNDYDSGQACDSTGWGWTDTDFATPVTLVTGLNKLVAYSSELDMLSSEVDVTSKSATGANVTITATWTDTGESWWLSTHCGDIVMFSFACLTPGENYKWHEIVSVPGGHCPNCWAVPDNNPEPFTADADGFGQVEDSSQTTCPGDVTTTCSCTSSQAWWVEDLGTHNSYNASFLSGNTSRVKSASVGPPKTSTVTFSSN